MTGASVSLRRERGWHTATGPPKRCDPPASIRQGEEAMHVKPTSEPTVAAASGANRTGPAVARHHGHTAADTHPSAGEDGQRQSWLVLALALAAQILVVLDISVVNTALPTIGTDLGLDGGQLQWLVTAYLMMSGGGLLFGGRVADLLSRRSVFLAGLGLFTAASVLSGLSDTGTQLVAARAIQGLSAALLTPAALSLITTTYGGRQRKTALAMWGAVGSLGVAAGVLVGGAITTWSSWQFIF